MKALRDIYRRDDRSEELLLRAPETGPQYPDCPLPRTFPLNSSAAEAADHFAPYQLPRYHEIGTHPTM